MGRYYWTDEEETTLEQAVLQRGGIEAMSRADWAEVPPLLPTAEGGERDPKACRVHYKWFVWVRCMNLDPRHPVTHAPELVSRGILRYHQSWPEGAPTQAKLDRARAVHRAQRAKRSASPSSASTPSSSSGRDSPASLSGSRATTAATSPGNSASERLRSQAPSPKPLKRKVKVDEDALGTSKEENSDSEARPRKRITQAEETSSDESSEEEADAQEPLAEGSSAERRHSSTDVENAPDDDARRRKTQKQQPVAEAVKRGARSPAPDPTPQVKEEVAGGGESLDGQLSAFLSALSPDFNFSRHIALFLHQDIETPRQLRAIARGGEAELKALAEDLKKDVVGGDGARVKGMSAAWANRFVAVMMENVKKDGQA